MIDFRYHLVSLVSVFMALAIGVVLGAGPLKGELGDTLTAQVEALRKDKENLQQAVSNRDARIETADAAITALGESSVAGSMNGHTATIIVLPGVERDAVEAISSMIGQAGAGVGSVVTVTGDWSDPGAAAARAEAATTLTPLLVDSVNPAATDPDEVAAVALARAVAAKSPSERDPAATQVITALSDANLVAVADTKAARADVIVIAVAGPGAAAGDDVDWRKAELTANVRLATTMAAASTGTVVVGTSRSDDKGGLVATLRADPQASVTLSTVDGLGSSTATVATAFAAARTLSGSFGHYGTGPDAATVMPAAPGAAPASTPAPASP